VWTRVSGLASPGKVPRAARPEPKARTRRVRLRREAQHPAAARRAGLPRDRGAGAHVRRAGARTPTRRGCSSRTAPASRGGGRRCDPWCASWPIAVCPIFRHLPRPPDPGLALGGTTKRLKFGHHGGNQPGQDLATRKVAICAENHGYAVDAESLRAAGEPVEITHINLNDGTVEDSPTRRARSFRSSITRRRRPARTDAGYFFGRSARWCCATSAAKR